MHNLCLIMLATNTIFIDLLCLSLPKLHVKFQRQSLKSFWSKMSFEQKLAISKIWAKKSTKIAKNWSFP